MLLSSERLSNANFLLDSLSCDLCLYSVLIYSKCISFLIIRKGTVVMGNSLANAKIKSF